MRDARYMRLISWTLRCGSEQLAQLLQNVRALHIIALVTFSEQ